MSAYYNEIDPYAAQWLRNLIAARHIADGVVDERSIKEVTADDVRGFTQCHFFAGIGGWSHALRSAGWVDGRSVWTGSCPCQPFSAAGCRGGTADERHLWPDFFHLIRECRPDVVFGEQVASNDGLGWLDAVLADLEGADYAAGAVDICAAGVGAPHIRQRLYWVADANHAGLEGRGGVQCGAAECATWTSGVAVGVADANREGIGGRGIRGLGEGDSPRDGASCERSQGLRTSGGVAHPGDERREGERLHLLSGQPRQTRDEARRGGEVGGTADAYSVIGRQGHPDAGRCAIGGASQSRPGPGGGECDRRPAPTNGFWRDADWVYCRDDKWRPVEPGAFPLVDGSAGRVGRLRAYGNAIVPQVAAEFIGAFMECRP